MNQKPLNGFRLDYRVITDMVHPGARVLDLGCGNGELMQMLIREKQVRAQGVEISEQGISECLFRGVQAIQGDIDEGLSDYPDGSFDYVILNQTLQVVKKPAKVLWEMVRVGDKAIVGFPNFGYLGIRLSLLVRGTMPKTKELPFEWYDTPNIRLLTIKDFENFAQANDIRMLKKIFLPGKGKTGGCPMPNLLARTAIYVIERKR